VADLVPYTNRPKQNGFDLDADLDARARAATESTGLREYLGMVRRHWWVVILTFVLSTAYTANSAMKERPVYRSSSTVRLVDARREVAGDIAGRQDAPGVGFGGSQADPIESQIQVLTSGAVAAVAVDLNGLRLEPADRGQYVDEISRIKVSDSAVASSLSFRFGDSSYSMQSGARTTSAAYGLPVELDGVQLTVSKRPPVDTASLVVVPRESAIAIASSGFSASSRPRTDILDLSYTGTDPWQAKRMANAMAEAFRAHNATSAKEISSRRRAFLENQLRQTDSMLAAAQGAYTAYRSGRQVFSSVQRAGAQESNLIDIDTKRADLMAEKTTYLRLVAQARASSNSSQTLRVLASSPGIAGNPVVQQFYSQLETYSNARDSLLNSGAAPTNPDVTRIVALIPATAEKMLDAVESQIQSIQARVDALDRLRASGASKIAEAPAAEAREQDLVGQVQTIQQMSRQLQDELQRAKMSEAVEGGQVEIVQLATSPGYQIPTGKQRKLFMGGLVGFIIGCVAAILLDGLNASVRKRSDIERLLGIPSLAVIPRLPGAEHRRRSTVLRALPRLSNASRATRQRADSDLVTVNDIRSPASEAFRNLRTNLMFSQSVNTMRTLVVTSASPNEGKTTTASNLAVSFAQQGLRVLLVDCDLRRSRIHRIFGLSREPGFTDLVLGYATEESVTHPTSTTGLYVIASGKLPPNPAELLGGDTARRTFASLIEGYDLVVIDTPPLLAASDAAILATIANGVVLVLRAGATETAAAQQSVQQLQSVGARIVGAVLNDPDAQVPRYGAYYKYDYSAAEAS
jgi:capsular exopolysaccharide synthesis family protein